MDSLPCLNSKIFYFWNKQQIQNWGVEQFPGKQNERESFSPRKIEKYNRYKDKIIFSLEFNIWKLRRWIEFRSAILKYIRQLIYLLLGDHLCATAPGQQLLHI